MQELYAKVQQPGEDGVETFRLEVGRNDGTAPSPSDAMYMAIKVIESVVGSCGIENPKEMLIDFLKTGPDIEEFIPSETSETIQ